MVTSELETRSATTHSQPPSSKWLRCIETFIFTLEFNQVTPSLQPAESNPWLHCDGVQTGDRQKTQSDTHKLTPPTELRPYLHLLPFIKAASIPAALSHRPSSRWVWFNSLNEKWLLLDGSCRRRTFALGKHAEIFYQAVTSVCGGQQHTTGHFI